MARYTGPKFKVYRREGVNVTGSTSSRLEKVIHIPPGAPTKRRRPSEYGLQPARETASQARILAAGAGISGIFEEAQRRSGQTGLNLLQMFERRLDNIVYRLGFTHTRPMARQLVTRYCSCATDRSRDGRRERSTIVLREVITGRDRILDIAGSRRTFDDDAHGESLVMLVVRRNERIDLSFRRLRSLGTGGAAVHGT